MEGLNECWEGLNHKERKDHKGDFWEDTIGSPAADAVLIRNPGPNDLLRPLSSLRRVSSFPEPRTKNSV